MTWNDGETANIIQQLDCNSLIASYIQLLNSAEFNEFTGFYR